VGIVNSFTTLEDAYFYYYQAKAASDTKRGQQIRQRHLRTCVFLSWIAVEDALKSRIADENITLPKGYRGPRLLPRIRFVFAQLGHEQLDETEFDRHRQVRNKITHPSGSEDVSLTLKEAEDVLAYCKSLMKSLYPHLVVREPWIEELRLAKAAVRKLKNSD
jgi:hypothetical protein